MLKHTQDSLDKSTPDTKMIPRISNFGRYLNKYGTLKTFENSLEAYPSIYLYKRTIRVHRLVHCLFNDPHPPQMNYVIDHLDGNSRNNRASNLEWVTNSVNLKRAFLKRGNKKKEAHIDTEVTDYNKDEVWKPHPVYKDIEFSTAGRFRRKNKIPSVGTLKTSGYRVCFIEGRTQYMHRLVAQTFIDRKAGCDYVDHIDGNRQNNSTINLRWVTQSENNKNRRSVKNKSKGNDFIVVSTLPGEVWKDLTREVVMAIPCSTHSRIKRGIGVIKKGLPPSQPCPVVGETAATIPSRVLCEEDSSVPRRSLAYLSRGN